MKTVPEMLRESADTYEQRNKLYGNSYKEHGKIMMALFPNGVTLESEDDHNRWGVFNMMVSKLKRYAEQMDKQGHDDSLLDLSTYTSMLRELDEEIRQRGATAGSNQFNADRVVPTPDGFGRPDLSRTADLYLSATADVSASTASESAAIAQAYEAGRRDGLNTENRPRRHKDASEVLPHIINRPKA